VITAMRTAAILPVKRFSHAKQRLGGAVSEQLRADLARAMVGDVLSAIHHCTAIERAIVITAEPLLAAAARYQGAIVLEDRGERGQSAAVAHGLARAGEEGFERALCVPGDCPTIDPAELRALLGRPAPSGGEVVIVPDRHGHGTNGLLLSPPHAIAPAFGPGSCERHRAHARAAGLACRVERPASLLLDIDTGEDLDALRELLARAGGGAPRTRAVLGLREEAGWGASPSAA